jgi:hypothetical protein
MSPALLLGVLVAAYVALVILVLRSRSRVRHPGLWLIAGLVFSPLVLAVYLVTRMPRRTGAAASSR